MAPKEKGLGTINTLLLVGVFFAVWNSGGCTEHSSFTKTLSLESSGSAKNQTSPSPLNSASPSPGSIAGNWLCIDNERCEQGTVKIISNNLHTIETTFTQHLPVEKQVCRIHEISRLSSRTGNTDTAVSGDLYHGPIQVLASPENTKNCGEYYEKVNLESREIADSVSIDYNSEADQIKVNGTAFRRLSDKDLQDMNTEREETNLTMSSLAGDWLSNDDKTDELHQKISSDLQELTTISVVKIPSQNQICHIQLVSSLEIVDNTDPNKIYATQVRGSMSLIADSKNTEKCGLIVDEFNTDHLIVGVPESITIERDGNQELTIQGKSFTRITNKGTA